MCDFCENITNEVDGDLSHRHGGLALVRDKDGNPCIVQEFVDDYGEMACLVSEPIRFCPMCGRKLSEETEKQGIKDKILDEIRKTQPNFLDFSEFYNQYGWLIPGIGDVWHWYEKLTDDAKKEGFAQITDMSAEELFEFYVKIRDDWEAWYKIRLDEKEGTEN